MNKIIMKLDNKQKGNVKKLTIYISQNFTILDQNHPMFYYISSANQDPLLYGIILPQKERRVFIEITCIKGDVHAKGTYSRDSALNNKFEEKFSSGYRKVLEIEVDTSNYYIRIEGLENHSQGYIKFTAISQKYNMPFSYLKNPEKDLPIMLAIKDKENELEYSDIHFQFQPLACSSQIKSINDIQAFQIIGIQYTLIITHEKQLAHATDFIFSQIPGDLTSMEQSIDIYNDGDKKHTALFFTFEEDSSCIKECTQCKLKEVTIPLKQQTFNTYVNDSQPFVIVRATIQWRNKDSNNDITQNIYYSDAVYNKETLFPPIIPDTITSEGVSITLILFIIVGSLVLIFFVVFYFRKYKQTEKRLNFELTDVRNVANLTSMDSVLPKSQLKHIPLDEEIDE